MDDKWNRLRTDRRKITPLRWQRQDCMQKFYAVDLGVIILKLWSLWHCYSSVSVALSHTRKTEEAMQKQAKRQSHTWTVILLKHWSRKTLSKLGGVIKIPDNPYHCHNLLDLLHIYSWEYNNWQIILDELQDHNLMYQVWSNNSLTYAQSKIQSMLFLYYNYL